MAVEIKIDLKAKKAQGKIGAIAASLKGLERVANDIDIDFDADVGEITDEINEFADALKDIDVGNISFLDDLEKSTKRLEEAMDGEIDLNVPGKSGGGNASDGTIPDGLVAQLSTVPGDDNAPDWTKYAKDSSGVPNKEDLARKIENVGGFDKNSVKVRGDFDAGELNKIASKIEHTTQDLTSGEYPHISGIGDGNLGTGQMPGNFADAEDPSEMDWNKLQRRASEAGVYTQDADRSTLESRLTSQQFGGKTITVDTPSHGTVGIRQARRIQQGSYDFPDAPDAPESFDYDKGAMMRFARDKSDIPDTDLREATPSNQLGLGSFSFRRGKIDNKAIESAKESLGGFGSTLRKLKPTMGKYMQFFAAIIPIAVALGTQLLGVAAAMGSVAVAGGAIMGLGLLGHGESLAGSMSEAKQQVRSLKQEMFQMAQPTMQQFAPLQAQMFDAMPEGLGPVFEEMEGLTAYEDTLFNLGGALAGGMEEAVEIIVDNEEAISGLTTKFGGLIGAGLLDFFEWLIKIASKNEALIYSLGKGMVQLAVVAYNLSMAIAKIVNTLTPVIALFAYLTGFLNNKAIMALFTFITVTYLTVVALSKLGLAAMVALSKIGIFGSGSFIGGIMSGMAAVQAQIAGLIAEYTALTGAAASAAAAMAMTGIGLLAVGAGSIAAAGIMSDSGGDFGGGGMGGSGGQVYNDNRTFNIQGGNMDDYANMKAVNDSISRNNETTQAQSLPDVETSSTTSDTPPEN
jgi:hypothetical protein